MFVTDTYTQFFFILPLARIRDNVTDVDAG